MYQGKIVFAQLMELLPLQEFQKCVRRYNGARRIRRFSCLDQYLCMAFAQLTWRDSLRDIEHSLRAVRSKLYHMGIRGNVSRSTLADANERRDWRIFADFAHHLIATARSLYAQEQIIGESDLNAYVLDASMIELCLSLFPWAEFRSRHGAMKLHTLLDLRGNIPVDVYVTYGRIHDIHALDWITLEPGSFYIMDRGYADYDRLYRLHQAHCFFLIRLRGNARFQRLESFAKPDDANISSDQRVRTYHFRSRQSYPEPLRRIHIFNRDEGQHVILLTNNFALPATTLAQLYKCRWQIELFFKWLKQHLRIKAFYGTSENAVKTQIWTAISVYVLVAILKKQLRLEPSLYTILQILSITLFEKLPISQALTTTCSQNEESQNHKQLEMFNL